MPCPHRQHQQPKGKVDNKPHSPNPWRTNYEFFLNFIVQPPKVVTVGVPFYVVASLINPRDCLHTIRLTNNATSLISARAVLFTARDNDQTAKGKAQTAKGSVRKGPVYASWPLEPVQCGEMYPYELNIGQGFRVGMVANTKDLPPGEYIAFKLEFLEPGEKFLRFEVKWERKGKLYAAWFVTGKITVATDPLFNSYVQWFTPDERSILGALLPDDFRTVEEEPITERVYQMLSSQPSIGLLGELARYPMATTSPSTAAQPTVGQALQDAVYNFRNVLDDNQRRELDAMKPIPDANSILVFTARLDCVDPNRRGRSFSSRLHTILLAVRNFCSIVDTFTSSHPEIAALVWGSIKLTMLLISNYTSYCEATSDLFMREFKPDIDAMQRSSQHVKEEIALAQAQADAQEQQLQALEREKASAARSIVNKFFIQFDDEMQENKIKKKAQGTQERTKKLLDALSTYKHLRLLKQSRLKRYRDTSNWMFQTPEFHQWIDGEVPLLCCFGKIGSGKTIATSSVIDYILAEKGSDCDVSFFFVESGNQESLSPETLIRSILRQILDLAQIPQGVVDGLEQLDSFSELDELVKLLNMTMLPPRVSYIFIDGLDERDKPDRCRLLKALSSLDLSAGNIRLFFSSRDSLQREIRRRFTIFNSLSMGCALAHDDISIFIGNIVREKIQNNEMSIGDPSLEDDIISALSQGAQGMFLWVTFRIYEICAQHCDEDIRNILKDLPKSLKEIYCRVLQRIKSRGHKREAKKIFPWIAASKQLLSLNQLRETIAIRIGQQYTKPERLYNDIGGITLWCENLVQVDEEDQLVQFAHSTIRKFLTEEPLDPTLAEFCINLKEADHDIGEICVTYLNFNDFKTTVARRPKPMLLHDPTQIAQSALVSQSRTASMLAKLRPKSTSKPVDLSSLQTLTGKAASIAHENLILYLIVTGVHTGSLLPYDQYSASPREEGQHVDSAIACPLLQTAAGRGQLQIVERLLTAGADVNAIDANGRTALYAAAAKGQLEVIERLFTAKADVNAGAASIYGRTALQAAAVNGQLEVVERLLAAKAGVNASTSFGCTPLYAAVERGHLKVAERLLTAKADVNAADANGRAALHVAAEKDQIRVVERLPTAEADINAADSCGYTALFVATEKGHLKTVKCLLLAGADVNSSISGRLTMLQAAKKRGHWKVVSVLESAGAYI
ncbi:hypothetical protein NUW58_g4580 [Xylaria curta]|uniref:Uncharacterized protein n=1 Tax=Xylaria curta TaxID=42375 RepID=A0ACC1P8A9_9PEZI|nr:hypothetical protein NUW58_g4580 [Xylaria curta]